MKNVLLAIDGSKYAQDAAKFFSRLPHDETMELAVLTVVEPPPVTHGSGPADWIHETIERDQARAQESFRQVAELFEGANINIRHITRSGNRGTSIIEVAKEIEADLLVVGARGHSTVSRLLLGSTSDYVATHAHCSVLVVRPGSGQPAELGTHAYRVAVAYDDTGPAQAALEEISEVQWGGTTDFHVIGIATYVSDFFGEIVVDSSVSQALTTALERATEQIRRVAPKVQSHLIENEHTGESIVKFVEQQDCDLVVVGETPRNLLGRVLLGSVSRFVLRHAPCSVWVTRNRLVQGNTAQKHAQSTTS